MVSPCRPNSVFSQQWQGTGLLVGAVLAAIAVIAWIYRKTIVEFFHSVAHAPPRRLNAAPAPASWTINHQDLSQDSQPLIRPKCVHVHMPRPLCDSSLSISSRLPQPGVTNQMSPMHHAPIGTVQQIPSGHELPHVPVGGSAPPPGTRAPVGGSAPPPGTRAPVGGSAPLPGTRAPVGTVQPASLGDELPRAPVGGNTLSTHLA